MPTTDAELKASQALSMQSVFNYHPRTTEPNEKKGYPGWEFYVYRGDKGGLNPYNHVSLRAEKTGCTALYNCVNYVIGRINEIHGSWKWTYMNNGGGWYDGLPGKYKEFKKSKTPQVGAIAVWHKIGYSADVGHVAIVESVKSDGTVRFTEAAFNSASIGWGWRYYPNYINPKNYWKGHYEFLGYLLHPDLQGKTVKVGGVIQQTPTNLPDDYDEPGSYSGVGGHVLEAKEITTTAFDVNKYSRGGIAGNSKESAIDIAKTKGKDLLSSATFVESPFIIAKIGEYTFGSYSGAKSLKDFTSHVKVNYPNYMESLRITKTNGVLNQYELNMVYQIIPGKDPNLIDKVLSTVSESRKITFTYGDWEMPTMICREEEAIITKVTSKVDFANQVIRYTLYCTSTALKASACQKSFDAITDTGSNIITQLIKNNNYGLLDVFPGMANLNKIKKAGLIPADDTKITVPAMTCDPITYLGYVVTSMKVSSTVSTNIKDSTYHLVIMDDVENDFGGMYFKVVRLGTTKKTLASQDVYEVDIGFPTNTLVTDFQINTDNSWAILYNSAQEVDFNNYAYRIDNEGNITMDYVNSASLNAYNNRVNDFTKTWWTQMTQFPITATLTVKGLLRTAMLMSYIRINTYFYGQKHTSTGIYAVTKQEDSVNSSGYRTTLSLVRIPVNDDEDYVAPIVDEKQKKVTVPNKKVDTAPKTKTVYTKEEAQEVVKKKVADLYESREYLSNKTAANEWNELNGFGNYTEIAITKDGVPLAEAREIAASINAKVDKTKPKSNTKKKNTTNSLDRWTKNAAAKARNQ